MPNTSATGICDEEDSQSVGSGDSIIISHITPTLSDRLNELLRSDTLSCSQTNHAVRQGAHLGHMTHNGPILKAKRQFGKEKS